ncbi:DUF2891 domain-containing protein [Amycolatopsis cihanbeyliensis]|uniref:DUF2891 family protein n=1 Tax=Amycolatopsis cihanbeyliensis TaxID=1128664 RepID=A0A542DNA8_AMYCI|nr:DUF2891 domain-containing protein [Amycolatopsis cihanbeyliensis]TQJ04465.1 DUF2891 family protein [Amycolatopsis cihanbeyliensis]
MTTRGERRESELRSLAPTFARTALTNIAREYPHHESHLQTSAVDRVPRPRDLHPAFFGSYDWHSCVEMHWLLLRLLRLVPDAVPREEVRAALDEHLGPAALAAEADYFARVDQRANERPYGWGWALMLTHEAATCRDPAAARWTESLTTLASVFVHRYLEWLPLATYPVRYGVHGNSAFGLSLALPYARMLAESGDGRLLDAVTAAAHRWFGDDRDYPAGWEPSGADFLSPALVEAELMAGLLPAERYASWLDSFLPGIAAGEPATLFTPAFVSDLTDGYIAHLHGLNLSRAWCWRRLAESLPGGDPRAELMFAAAEEHAEAALGHATGSDYAVEHWLACYAVLLLS